MNVAHTTFLDNDQYYLTITDDGQVRIYSMKDLSQSLFQYHLKSDADAELFAVQTHWSNVILFLFMDQFVYLEVKFDSAENRFKLHSEQSLSIPNREVEYALQFSPDQRFLILEQALDSEIDPELNDYRIFTYEKSKIVPTNRCISHTKSKMSKDKKITGFRTYTWVQKQSAIWLAHQGNILQVHLPSPVAELPAKADYHCWMRHALASYQQTAEKSSLSVTITSLAVQSKDESCVASGADDGSIVIWHLTDTHTHAVLESIHIDEVRNVSRERERNRSSIGISAGDINHCRPLSHDRDGKNGKLVDRRPIDSECEGRPSHFSLRPFT